MPDIDETKRTRGKDALRSNIAAAKAVANTVRPTLGPKGMDKMIVNDQGDVIVTNDGVTILQEMHVEHPIAKMFVDVARTQERVVGDGTTTAVVLAGELLSRAESLIDQNIHPTLIVRGYRHFHDRAQHYLWQMAKPVSLTDIALLQSIATTAMTGKGVEGDKEILADLLVKAVVGIARDTHSDIVDLDHIKIETEVGVPTKQSRFIAGLLIDKEKVHPAMPAQVSSARIALLDVPLEIKNTDIDAKIQITDPHQLNNFLEQEERTLHEIVCLIKSAGANVVFCQRGIDDLAQYFLSREGIIAARRVKKSDMEKLSLATGGRIVSSIKDLKAEDLGFAGAVREEKIGEDKMLLVEGCSNPRAVTLLVAGSTGHVASEARRAVTDALGDLTAALREKKVVAGAGAVEMRLSSFLRQEAMGLTGREQLIALQFVEALEVIPRTLVENAGLDSLDMLTLLRLDSREWAGVNVFSGQIMDAWEQGVIEPLAVKTVALSSAMQVVEMILRIDDVILGKPRKAEKGFDLE